MTNTNEVEVPRATNPEGNLARLREAGFKPACLHLHGHRALFSLPARSDVPQSHQSGLYADLRGFSQ